MLPARIHEMGRGTIRYARSGDVNIAYGMWDEFDLTGVGRRRLYAGRA
jgi:hypothetical protein